LHEGVGLGEVESGVDAEDVFGREAGDGEDLAAERLKEGGGVGEVVFALGVVGLELVEGVPEAGEVEDVAAWVNFADGGFFGGAVALFDDAEEAASGVAEDAAEAGWVVDECGAEEAGGVFVVLAFEQFGEGFGAKQGFVADED
jgi:hypothetical protein